MRSERVAFSQESNASRRGLADDPARKGKFHGHYDKVYSKWFRLARRSSVGVCSMSYIVSYTIKGVSITFFDKHVCLEPDTDLDNPRVLEAVRTALKLCPIIHAYHFIEEMAGSNSVQVERLSHELLEQIGSIESMLSQQDLVELTPRMRSFLQEALVEKQYRYDMERLRQQAASLQGPRAGFVYLLRAATDQYKIGRTKDPKNRKETFDVKLPFPVEFECLIPTQDMFQLEKALHQRFGGKRLRGEWFDLSEEDVAYIKSLDGGE
jgi:hypothetical protein